MQPSVIGGADGVPPQPDWTTIYADELDAALAQKVWGLAIREMRDRETLTVANGLQIERYCRAYVLYEQASRQIEEYGPIVRGEKGESYSPWWSIMKDADGRATQHEAELGLSPRRRANASKVDRKNKQKSTRDAFLSSRTG